MEEKQVTFYPAYAYRMGDKWKIPIRIWVRTTRNHLQKALEFLIKYHHSEQEIARFQDRSRDLFADDLEGQSAVFVIGSLRIPLTNSTGQDGVIEEEITVDAKEAVVPRNPNGWASCRVECGGSSADGEIQFIEPEGVSVISDIDDTIKVTEIPAGVDIVLRNTFFREFATVKTPQVMAAEYRRIGPESFHYVSGGPWHLYRPLAEFLLSSAPDKFPKGTFHFKTLDPGLRSTKDWLASFVETGFSFEKESQESTKKQKIDRITELMTHLSNRKFILFGDSGEMDPEVYQVIQAKFAGQVTRVVIRDVKSAFANDRGRFALHAPLPDGSREMEHLDALEIKPGKTQYPWP